VTLQVDVDEARVDESLDANLLENVIANVNNLDAEDGK
jgi:hypothetical protein